MLHSLVQHSHVQPLSLDVHQVRIVTSCLVLFSYDVMPIEIICLLSPPTIMTDAMTNVHTLQQVFRETM